MKVRYTPVALVLITLLAVLGFKMRDKPHSSGTQEASASPRILLVATSEEASSPTRCGEIVHLIRDAARRGIAVSEVNPEDNSELLTRYKIISTPTVIILGSNGSVESRYEGESAETLTAVRSQVEKLKN